MSNSLWPHGLLYSPWNSPGQNTEVGSLSFLQGIFPTEGSNPGLPHCGLILYQLSHKGSPRMLGWGAYPSSSGSSQPRDRTRVSCIAGRFFTTWAIREAQDFLKALSKSWVIYMPKTCLGLNLQLILRCWESRKWRLRQTVKCKTCMLKTIKRH